MWLFISKALKKGDIFATIGSVLLVPGCEFVLFITDGSARIARYTEVNAIA